MGDEGAALTLERTLLVSHAAAREAVRKHPRDPGAARLRMILALFDDAVVRARADDPNAPRVGFP